jgi:vacuolar protein sorting-associated protein 13A/C
MQLHMPLNKKMDINILLADFKIMLHAGPLMQVLSLIAMNDPALTPPLGKYIK